MLSEKPQVKETERIRTKSGKQQKLKNQNKAEGVPLIQRTGQINGNPNQGNLSARTYTVFVLKLLTLNIS